MSEETCLRCVCERLRMEWHNASYPRPLCLEVVREPFAEVVREATLYNYATQEEAERASKIAQEDAAEQIAEGFDFGYFWPGDIRKGEDGTFTVVIP